MTGAIPLLPLHSKMTRTRKFLIFYFLHHILYSCFFLFDLRNDAFCVSFVTKCNKYDNYFENERLVQRTLMFIVSIVISMTLSLPYQ